MILIKLLKYKIAHVVNKDLYISLLMMDTLKSYRKSIIGWMHMVESPFSSKSHAFHVLFDNNHVCCSESGSARIHARGVIGMHTKPSSAAST